MKKIFIAIAALTAMTFASCGGSTSQGGENDSIVCTDDEVCETEAAEAVEAAEAEATNAVSAIAAEIKNGDASTIKAKIAEVEAYIEKLAAEGKTEAIQAYATKLKDFIEENKDKLEELKIENTESISALVSSLSTISAENKDKIMEAVTKLKAAASSVDGEASEALNEAKESLKDKANEAINDAVEDAKSKAYEEGKKAGEDARNKVNEAVNDAKKNLGL